VTVLAAPDIASLVAGAFAAMEQAYAPYSGFRVGAAIRGTDGSENRGCNVENAAYPSGICAERVAVSTAVTNGVRTFTTLVVATEADVPTPPCGVCRQVLIEFSPELEIVSVTRAGAQARWTLRDLLLSPFTPASLSHA
jgi:cytidine deaminase